MASIPKERMRGQAAPAMPPPFSDVMPSGQECDWRMPDHRKLIAFETFIPDPLTAATITLLKRERQYDDPNDRNRFHYDAQASEGMYNLAREMLVWPKFDPSREYGDGETLGRRELGYLDLVWLYNQFRLRTRFIARPAPTDQQSEHATEPVPDRGDVRADASAAIGD